MRSCIFCGDRASTKEDAWPKWLMQLLNGTTAGRMEAERDGQALQSWSAVKPELKVRFVCARCNNGWMSQLEVRVKPIVVALFGENQVTLNSGAQTALAVWSVKSAMVYEALSLNRSWFFTESEHRALRETLQPATQTSVWLAKCVGWKSAFCIAKDLTGTVENSAEKVKAYITTMGFGPLAIQVCSLKLPISDAPNIAVTGHQNPGPWNHITLNIWPVQQEQVTWPPSIGLSSELGLQAFSERWSPIANDFND